MKNPQKKLPLLNYSSRQIVEKLHRSLFFRLKKEENKELEKFQILKNSMDIQKSQFTIVALCKNLDFDARFDEEKLLANNDFCLKEIIHLTFPYTIYIVDVSFRETRWETSYEHLLENSVQYSNFRFSKVMKRYFHLSHSLKSMCLKNIFTKLENLEDVL